MDNHQKIAAEICELFADKGESQYGGEAVSQVEHALQCAELAEQEGATPQLIIAALLHDIGHMLHELPDDAPEQGIDDFHEESGYLFVEQRFCDAVAVPVRQHVAAKRYLCATEDGYMVQLSEPSVVSLKIQGGPMDAAQQAKFRELPYWRDALRLRRWDDTGKIAHKATPDVAHYLNYLTQM